MHAKVCCSQANVKLKLSGIICDLPRENRPSSHLVMIVEIPVLKFLIGVTIGYGIYYLWCNQLLLVFGRLSLVELDTTVYWFSCSVA